jgi:hypothetical protein
MCSSRSIRHPPTERVAPCQLVWRGAFLLSNPCCALARAVVVAQLRQLGSLFRARTMTTISITAEAYAAIEAAFPGDWRNEIRLDGEGGYLLTLPEGMIALLEAVRGPGESHSDAIIRILDS